jgi:hypothetical protein
MSILGTIIQKGAQLGALVSTPRQPSSELQQQQLLELLREARYTAFGLEHNFYDIFMSDDPIKAFKEAVPATDYNGIYEKWWSKAHLEDAPDVCWPGVVPYYALSSGTSQTASKYIPVTEDLLRGMKRGSRRLFYDLTNYGIPGSQYTKHMLMIGSCTQLQRQGNHWWGDLSGIMGLNRPFVMERSYRPGRHITDMPEWGDRIEKIAEEAPSWDIGFSVSNPMWLQLVLERIIEKHKLKHIHELWPNFSLFVHGGVMVDPYIPSLEQLFGQPMHYMDSYGTSEGFLAYQQHPDNRSMKMLGDCGVFMEFVPFNEENFDENGDLRSSQPQSLRLEEVKEGIHYAILLSTTAGAWRYLLGDTIQFTSAEQAELKITGRTKQFLSACGEHLSIDNLSAAVRAVDEQLRAGVREFAVSAVREGTFWAHQWYVSLENQSVTPEEFVRVVDAELGRLNDDYIVERRYALREVRARFLPQEVFLDWLVQRGKLNGQAKIPRVLKGTQLSDFQSFIDK